MKRLARFSMPIVGIILLSSCYVTSVRPNGSITINFGQTRDRTISSSAVVRVYLYTYSPANSYSLFTFPDGKQYTEMTYGSGTQTISGIPQGLWQVLASIGSDGPNGALLATRYGASQVVQVFPGTSSGASIQTVASPFTYSSDLAGLNLNGLYVDPSYGYVYASSKTMLYENYLGIDASGAYSVAMIPSPMPPVTQASQIAAAGLTINSVNAGYYYSGGYPTSDLFVNTNEGIAVYDPTNGFDTVFSQNLTDSSGQPYSVFQSAAAQQNTASAGNIGIGAFYRRSQGFGGIYLTVANSNPDPNPSLVSWVDISLPSGSTGNSIYDMVVNGDTTATPVAYFATASGAFRSDLTLLQSGTITAQTLGQYVNYFSAPDNNPIQALAIFNGDLFVATSKGAYYGTLQESTLSQPPVASWTSVNAISGDSIVQMAGTQYYDQNQVQHTFVAFRSDYNLYILNLTTGVVDTYPFYSGLPGKLNTMCWFWSLLFIGGSEGLAAIQVSPAAPFSGL